VIIIIKKNRKNKNKKQVKEQTGKLSEIQERGWMWP